MLKLILEIKFFAIVFSALLLVYTRERFIKKEKMFDTCLTTALPNISIYN